MQFSASFTDNIAAMDAYLAPDKSFDLIKRRLLVGGDTLVFYYIDGFVKDAIMQRLMQYFLGLDGLPRGADAAMQFADGGVPYVEVDVTEDLDAAATLVLSGGVVALGETFGAHAVLIDARTYRTRERPRDARRA